MKSNKLITPMPEPLPVDVAEMRWPHRPEHPLDKYLQQIAEYARNSDAEFIRSKKEAFFRLYDSHAALVAGYDKSKSTIAQLETALAASKAEVERLHKAGLAENSIVLDLRAMLHRTATEAFGLDYTHGCEPYDEYFIRQVADLRAQLSAAVKQGEHWHKIASEAQLATRSGESAGLVKALEYELAHGEGSTSNYAGTQFVAMRETTILAAITALKSAPPAVAELRSAQAADNGDLAAHKLPAVATQERDAGNDMTTAEMLDTARLDWLESHGAEVDYKGNSGYTWRVAMSGDGSDEGAETLREAIDAAAGPALVMSSPKSVAPAVAGNGEDARLKWLEHHWQQSIFEALEPHLLNGLSLGKAIELVRAAMEAGK